MSIDIKNLEYKRESALYTMNDAQQAASHEFSKGYIRFLNHAKAEREAVSEMVKEAESKGFSDDSSIASIHTIDCDNTFIHTGSSSRNIHFLFVSIIVQFLDNFNKNIK